MSNASDVPRYLTDEEKHEIWRLFVDEGLSRREIGRQLGRDEKTIRRVVNDRLADIPLAEPNDSSYIRRMKEGHKIVTQGNEAVLTALFPADEDPPSLEDILEMFNVDEDVWTVDKFEVTLWHGFMKTNDGNPIKVPLHRVHAKMRRKVAEPIEFEPVAPVEVTLVPRKRERQQTVASDYEMALIIPDTHHGFDRDTFTGRLSAYHDREACDVAYQMAADLQPDKIILLGDHLDLAEWNDKYLRTNEMKLTTQHALCELAVWLADIRDACPNAEIIYMEGNHEHRMTKALLKNQAAACGLKPADEILAMDAAPALSIPRLLGLDGLDIRYVDDYPKGIYYLNNALAIIHGDVVRAKPSETVTALAKKGAYSYICGHCHRMEMAGLTVHSADGERTFYGFSPGTLARLDGIVPGCAPNANWHQGVAMVEYDPDSVQFQIYPVIIDNGMAIYQGVRYEGRPDVERLKGLTGCDLY